MFIRIPRYALKSFDPFAVGQFTSPWLVRYEDEVFFWTTLESVGRIVKDDVHLGALYSTLILATPGARLSEEAKVMIFIILSYGQHSITLLSLGLGQ